MLFVIAPIILIVLKPQFGNNLIAKIINNDEEIPPHKEIIHTGENRLPKNNDVIKVLKTTTVAPKAGLILIMAYKTIEFERPGFNQGRILGKGDSNI